MERRITQLEEGGKGKRKKKRGTLIAFPQILATPGGDVKRQAGPEEMRAESKNTKNNSKVERIRRRADLHGAQYK